MEWQKTPALVYIPQDATVLSKGSPFMGEVVEGTHKNTLRVREGVGLVNGHRHFVHPRQGLDRIKTRLRQGFNGFRILSTQNRKSVKTPFETKAGVAHETVSGEVIAELDLGSDMQVRALEPSSHIVPQLGFADEHERLPSRIPLPPYIQKSGETQSRRCTEIIASPDEGELQGHLVGGLVIIIHDILVQQFEVEDVLVIGGMEAVVESDERGMVDSVAAYIARGILVQTESAVVLDLDTEVFRFGLSPEIKAPCYLEITHERRVRGVVGMDVVIEIDEGEGVAPVIGIEELKGRCHAVGPLVRASRSQTAEVIIELQVRPCMHRYRAETDHRHHKEDTFFHGNVLLRR